MVGLFLSFFNTPEDIFTLKLYYNSTQQDNTDFSNYLTNEMQNIKGYDEIEAETFLNENKNFDLVSFEQIDNYKFLKKDDSYIVKDKSTNTIQYIEGFKYNKPYDKYEDIVDKSHFEDKFIMKGHSFVSFSTNHQSFLFYPIRIEYCFPALVTRSDGVSRQKCLPSQPQKHKLKKISKKI